MAADTRHPRRSFLSRLGTGATAAGLTALAGGSAAAQSAGQPEWHPRRHAEDDWLDPTTRQPPTVNVHRARLEALIKRGVHLAVCQMATRNHAGIIARAGGSDTDTVYTELVANLVGNAHMVPAGIVAVNRAQERGYSLAHC